jgi:hypothetical protein
MTSVMSIAQHRSKGASANLSVGPDPRGKPWSPPYDTLSRFDFQSLANATTDVYGDGYDPRGRPRQPHGMQPLSPPQYGM